MLSQNIIQVYENNKGEITVAKGEYVGVSDAVQIDSISLNKDEARKVIKAIKSVLSEMELSNALV